MGKRPALWAFATALLLVISSAPVHAQALAPSTLDLASHDQKKADDMVQVITQKSAPSAPDQPIKAITKKRTTISTKKTAKPVKQEPMQAVGNEPTQTVAKEPKRTIVKEPAQAVAKEPKRTIAKGLGPTFTIDPVRPMGQQSVSQTTQPYSRFSFKTLGGQKGIHSDHHAVLSQPDRLPLWQNRSAHRRQIDAGSDYRTGTRPCAFALEMLALRKRRIACFRCHRFPPEDRARQGRCIRARRQLWIQETSRV